jgi:hypothetical protein
MQVALHRTLRQIEHCRNLCHASILEVKERDHLALQFRQPGQALPQGDIANQCARHGRFGGCIER